MQKRWLWTTLGLQKLACMFGCIFNTLQDMFLCYTRMIGLMVKSFAEGSFGWWVIWWVPKLVRVPSFFENSWGVISCVARPLKLLDFRLRKRVLVYVLIWALNCLVKVLCGWPGFGAIATHRLRIILGVICVGDQRWIMIRRVTAAPWRWW